MEMPMRIAPNTRRIKWLLSIAAMQLRQPTMPSSAAAMYARQRPIRWKMDGSKKLNKADVKLIKLSGSVFKFGFPANNAPARLMALAHEVNMEKARAQHADNMRTGGHHRSMIMMPR